MRIMLIDNAVDSLQIAMDAFNLWNKGIETRNNFRFLKITIEFLHNAMELLLKATLNLEDEKIKEELIKEGGNEIRFTQYELPDESKENTAEFVYQDVFYTLNAVMDEEDFKKILKNLYFF